MIERAIAHTLLTILYVILWGGISFIIAVPTCFLWNWLIPLIFGLKAITYLQAWGVCWLAAIIFKSHSSSQS